MTCPSFDQVLRRMPDCCSCAYEACAADTGETVESIIAGVEHELQMYAEDQDGCITARQRNQCVGFLAWIRNQPFDLARRSRRPAAPQGTYRASLGA